MKNLILTAMLCFSVCMNAQNGPNMVTALMAAQESAWNNGDIDGFMSAYWKSDSLKFISKKGVTYGWQNTLMNYKKSYPTRADMGTLKFTLIETIRLGKDAVYVIGKWELEKTEPAGGHFTLLWRKIRDNWVIVADHTS